MKNAAVQSRTWKSGLKRANGVEIMLYKGYEIRCLKSCAGDSVVVEGVRDFNPVHVFECGQCFRWYREPDGSYTGVVRGRVANASYMPGRLILDNVTFEDFQQVWYDYFDLDRDYDHIKKAVATDDVMKKAVDFGNGIRLLRQEPWEVLISFIISANNRIPRIMKIVSDLSRLFGDELEYGGKKYFSFPDAKRLSDSAPEQIDECRAGYRRRYICQTAKMVAGGFRLEELAGMKAEDAKNALLQLKGVGSKVADCYLLYSGTRYDVFPTDVWVRRVMEQLYFGRAAGFGEIRQFAAERFGGYAGFAQQYLFYYARENRIGI